MILFLCLHTVLKSVDKRKFLNMLKGNTDSKKVGNTAAAIWEGRNNALVTNNEKRIERNSSNY